MEVVLTPAPRSTGAPQGCVFGPTLFRRVRRIAKSDYYLRHVSLSAWNNGASTAWIFMKFDI
jgi:hypothetical protein